MSEKRRNCILAEIVRLAGFVPPDFLDPSSSKYKLLILDFNYFTRTAHYAKRLSRRTRSYRTASTVPMVT
ncbi:hypothetical protein OSTOST_25087 [Ostertagia ostertagi]